MKLIEKALKAGVRDISYKTNDGIVPSFEGVATFTYNGALWRAEGHRPTGNPSVVFKNGWVELECLRAPDLPHLREVFFETLPFSNRYVVTRDGFTARYLAGRNVVIVSASSEEEEISAVLQITDWNKLYQVWYRLDEKIKACASEEKARAEGRDALPFLRDFLLENRIIYTEK